MLRVVGRILIFVFSLALLVMGISEMSYLFIQYINEFDALHIALSVIQGVVSIGGGLCGLIFITRSKRTEWISVSCLILLGLAIYYFVITNGNPFYSYYLKLGILNSVISVALLLGVFWNRRRSW